MSFAELQELSDRFQEATQRPPGPNPCSSEKESPRRRTRSGNAPPPPPQKKVRTPHWQEECVLLVAGLYTYWVGNRKNYLIVTPTTLREQMSAWRRGSRFEKSCDFMEDMEKSQWRAEGHVEYLRNRLAVCERELRYLPAVMKAAAKRKETRTTSWDHVEYHGKDCAMDCPSVKLHQLENLQISVEYGVEVEECRELERAYGKEIPVLQAALREELALLKKYKKPRSKSFADIMAEKRARYDPPFNEKNQIVLA
jgi:hypothetical protein